MEESELEVDVESPRPEVNESIELQSHEPLSLRKGSRVRHRPLRLVVEPDQKQYRETAYVGLKAPKNIGRASK